MSGEQEVRTVLTGEDRSMSRTFDKAADNAERSGGRIGKAVGLLGRGVAVGAGLAGAALVGFGVSAVKAASDAQQSAGATETVFKGAADTIMRTSKDAAKTYGLSANTYRENANLIGSLFKNQGVEIDQLAGKTNDMIGIASDLAATFGGSTTEAVEALSSAFKGEFDPLERYGISLKQSTVNAEAMRVANVKSAKEWENLTTAEQNAAEQTATTNLILGQSKDATGAFARETDTFAHKVQVLTAQWDDAKVKIGDELLPVLTDVAGWLSEKLPGAIDTAVEKWREFADAFSGKDVKNGSGLAGFGEELALLRQELDGSTRSWGENGAAAKSWGEILGTVFDPERFVAGVNDIIDLAKRLGLGFQRVLLTMNINALKAVSGIQGAFARLPGPVGEKFRKLRADTQKEINKIQGRLDDVNTSQMQAKLDRASTKLARLGRQRATPKVLADITQAQYQVARIQAQLHGIRDEYVNVFVSEVRRDMARSGGRAQGGSVQPGGRYLVGEFGAEEFRPSVPGTILPRPPVPGPRSAGGGDTIHVAIHAGTILSDPTRLQELVAEGVREARARGRRPARDVFVEVS